MAVIHTDTSMRRHQGRIYTPPPTPSAPTMAEWLQTSIRFLLSYTGILMIYNLHCPTG